MSSAFACAARGVRAASRAFAQRRSHRSNLRVVLFRVAYGGMLFLGLLTALVVAVPGFTPGQLISVLGLSSVEIGLKVAQALISSTVRSKSLTMMWSRSKRFRQQDQDAG